MQGTTTTRTRANGRVRGIFRARPPRGHRRLPGLAPTLLILLSLTGGYSIPSGSAIPASPSAPPAPAPDLDRVPLAFTPNVGFSDPAARFETRALGGTISFAPGGVVLSLPSAGPPADDAKAPAAAALHGLPPSPAVLRLRFLGADPAPAMGADAPLSGKVNWLIGDDPGRWRTDVPTYGGISYKQLYEGVDLRYDGHGSTLKGTYFVAPGADPAGIRWRYDGALATDVDSAGNLLIRLPRPDVRGGAAASGRTLTEQVPVAWQEREGTRIPVALRYDVAGDRSVGFAVGAYDRTRPLTLDPTIVYSTYLGGNNSGGVGGMAIDTGGNVYITGVSYATNFPTVNAIEPTGTGNVVTVVSKLAPSGDRLIYSTYIGGTSALSGPSGRPALDRGNNLIVGGRTVGNFPTVNALQPSYGRGDQDGFVFKLSASGDRLIYSTYLGGYLTDSVDSVAVDGQGVAYVVGQTRSQFDFLGCYGTFLVQIDPTGKEIVPGSCIARNFGVISSAVDSNGLLYLYGSDNDTTDFPLVNSIPGQSRCVAAGTCWRSVFAMKYRPADGTVLFSSYLGGSGLSFPRDLAIDEAGNMYLGGATAYTDANDFPLVNPYQSRLLRDNQSFVAKIDTNRGAIVFSTYITANGRTDLTAIAIDGSKNVYVAGRTEATSFPLVKPLQAARSGPADAFIVKLDPTGQTALLSTYFGGSGDDEIDAIAVDAVGTIYLLGDTNSPDLPVRSALQPTKPDANAGAFFIAKIGGDDAIPPVTTAVPSGPRGTASWYTGAVNVALTAKDNDGGSGVAKIEYNLDGAGWTSYTAPVIIAADGKHALQYRSTDNAGNVETPGSLAINIDATAPSTTAAPSGAAGGGGWYRGGVTLALSATDTAGGSGVAATTYAVNGGATQPYTAPVPFADGTYTVAYSSTDNAGNVEAAKTVALKVDTTPPATTAAVVPAPNAEGWSKTPVTVTLVATDTSGGSGVATTYYALDSTACTPSALASCATYTAGTPVPVTTDGTHTLTYFSADVAGNLEAAKTLTVKIDTIPPTITGTRTPAANANGWNNTDVTASFTCADNTGGSGIAACTAPVTVSAEGANQQVVGTATDAAGNSATATVGGISIDKTRPTVTYTGNAVTYTADQTVAITCAAADNPGGSGIATSTCRDITGPAYSFIIGANSYAASATDKAGNASATATASFTVTASVGSVSNVVNQFVANPGQANSLTTKLAKGNIDAFINEVNAQTGKALTQEQAQVLIKLANALR